ncbi:MAG: hypothetical protein CMJ23_13845 [Phycisphaerae bacterium]|nr:hypothetical protein [Phycisphaerae bacterium]
MDPTEASRRFSIDSMNSRTFQPLLTVGIRWFTPIFRRQWVLPPIQGHPADGRASTPGVDFRA